MAYPTDLDDLTSAIPAPPDSTHEPHHTALATAAEALEAKIGTGSSTPTTAGYVLTVVGAGETSWSAPVSLTGANGGTGAPGDAVTIAGGTGDDGNDPGASITVGGGDGAGGRGVITATGNLVLSGQLLSPSGGPGVGGDILEFAGGTGNDGAGQGANALLEGGGSAGQGGSFSFAGGAGTTGQQGGGATLRGGTGDAGNDVGALLFIGGGSGAGAPGSIYMTTNGFTFSILGGTADPSAGAGVATDIASLYARDNSGVGELWVKTGAADTAWTKVV